MISEALGMHIKGEEAMRSKTGNASLKTQQLS